MTIVGAFFAYWMIGLFLAHRHVVDLAAELHTCGPSSALLAIMRLSLSWPLWAFSNRP